jgi:hypothetical protein
MKVGSARAWGFYLIFIGLMMYGDSYAVVPYVIQTNWPAAVWGTAIPIAVIVGGVMLIMRSRRKK